MLAATVLMMLPFYIFSVIVSLVPPWQRPVIDEGQTEAEPSGPTPAWAADSRLAGDSDLGEVARR